MNFKNYEKIKQELIKKSKEQFFVANNFKKNFVYSKDSFVRGNFWHYNLMPKQDVIEKKISFNKELINKIKNKIPEIDSKNSMIIHFRGRISKII